MYIVYLGFKLIEEFSLNVTGFPVDKDADYIKVSAGVNTGEYT